MKWETRIRGIACVLASSGHFVSIEKKQQQIDSYNHIIMFVLSIAEQM